MTRKDEITQAIKNKIADNVAKNNKSDENNKADNTVLVDTLNYINDINKKLAILQAQVSTASEQVLSTTQFFNPSLAKDFYNMNGNSLQTNSYLAVRQMLGIVNNKTPGVLQSIPGVNGNSTGSNNPNGTAVGLTGGNRQMAGWWLWTMILNRITYFGQMFTVECEDEKLKAAIYKYLQDVVLAGYAVIVKDGENYKNYCCNNVELDKDGNLKSFEAYNSAFVINQVISHWEDEKYGIITLNNDANYVWGQWRSNGYNIWYYVMCYLLNSVDLLYIFWNRARLNKTVVLQKKGNSSTAAIEAQNFIDPYQNVVTVNTVGVLDNLDDTTEKVSLENKYDVLDLGHGEETQYSFTNFTLWNDYWDNEIGIRSSPINTNTNRSIADEISPLTIKLTKIQNDFKFCAQQLCDQIKEKWGVEVSIELIDDLLLNTLSNTNPSFKAEEGNESENKKNNGEGEG